jgi:formate C-acetyltransferase
VHQGTRYNGSGCLIHGLAVLADSFVAIDRLVAERPQDAEQLLCALRANFVGYEDLRAFLKACPKYGENESQPDGEAVAIASRVSDMVRGLTNYLGNPFRPDFSTPSTHLLYGYWVGATPDGRLAREMLNYGIDPLAGDAAGGLGLRALSAMKLPFEKFCGGYASHLGIDPKYFRGADFSEKGVEFLQKVVGPLSLTPCPRGFRRSTSTST